jgi:hypothetical protein
MDEVERCVHCRAPVVFGMVVVGEWTHTSGSRYCLDRNGFTATPLSVAQPTYHGNGDVL